MTERGKATAAEPGGAGTVSSRAPQGRGPGDPVPTRPWLVLAFLTTLIVGAGVVWVASSSRSAATEASGDPAITEPATAKSQGGSLPSGRSEESTRSPRIGEREAVVFGVPAASASTATDAGGDGGWRVSCRDRSGRVQEISGYTMTTWRRSARADGMDFDDWLRERVPRYFPLSDCEVVQKAGVGVGYDAALASPAPSSRAHRAP